MHSAIENMLKKYQCKTILDYENALKEIIQQVILLGLWRSKFFERAAFYGGTALRILHGLNRFSEDLDFSLLYADPKFTLNEYSEALITELEGFGLQVFIETKKKKKDNNIQTAFMSAQTKQQLITVSAPLWMIDSTHSQQKIKVKIEVDIDPPLNFQTENKILLTPFPFSVNIFQLSDLFASKIHAILCRNWKLRVKGRDWFDFIWYIAQDVPVRKLHLQTRLEKSGHWTLNRSLEMKDIKKLLEDRIDILDISQAKSDIIPFIQDKDSIEMWSHDFFRELIAKIQIA